MTAVFADTFYFLALLNKKDQAHELAVRYASTAGPITTTEWIMTEVADGVASTRQRKTFVEFRQEFLDNPFTEVVPLEMNLYTAGLQLYGSRADKAWSLTDCTSFVVMQQRSIHEALTGDHHFEQAGFVALLK